MVQNSKFMQKTSPHLFFKSVRIFGLIADFSISQFSGQPLLNLFICSSFQLLVCIYQSTRVLTHCYKTRTVKEENRQNKNTILTTHQSPKLSMIAFLDPTFTVFSSLV
jgi:hypothetical protein